MSACEQCTVLVDGRCGMKLRVVMTVEVNHMHEAYRTMDPVVVAERVARSLEELVYDYASPYLYVEAIESREVGES